METATKEICESIDTEPKAWRANFEGSYFTGLIKGDVATTKWGNGSRVMNTSIIDLFIDGKDMCLTGRNPQRLENAINRWRDQATLSDLSPIS